jgi:hypothetical protein
MDPCTICHEDLTPDFTYTTNCGHKFHPACFHTWINMSTNKACPLCRSEDGIELFLEDPNNVDASDMTWTCERCGTETRSDIVTCEGRCCMTAPDDYVWDARALCFPCAGVTKATVEAAPAFNCKRCVK